MQERLARLTPSQLNGAQQALYDAIVGGPRADGHQAFSLTDEDGSLVGPFGLMLHAPHLGQPLQELGAAVRFQTALSDREREIAILTVAVALDSEFEWYSHRLVGLAAGLTPDEITDLRSGVFSLRDGLDDAECAVHDLTRHLADGKRLEDEEYARATADLGERRLLELVVLIGYYRTLALMLEVFHVGAPRP